jgi:alkanesulfonate monooxygenase SsuD/methylene tetrahydromethanopterin reductase-like flavin-dependent oxidoreductase (luciferase family)
MRFSLYINPQTRGPNDDLPVIDAVTNLAFQADRAGFAAVHLTEHHFTGYNAFSDPFMFGAYLAPRLERVRIGFSVAVPPLHHPLRFAEHANLLDNFTRGRAIIGVGVGGGPIEFAGFDRDPARKHDLTEAVLDIVHQAWAHEYGDPPLVFDTPFFKGRLDGRIVPASYRKPHPLVARACVSDESVIRSAQRGWPVFTGRFPPDRTARQWALYRETLTAAGHAPELVQECLDWSAMLKMIYVSETDDKALDEAGPAIAYYVEAATLANSADSIETDVARREREAADAAAGRGKEPQAFAASVPVQKRQDLIDRAMIVGSPDTVARHIAAYAEAGVRQMMLWFTWGANDPRRVQRSFDLFVREVMPRFTPSAALTTRRP